MNRTFKSILWLDDMRQPLVLGIDWVKSYDEFVAYIEERGVPEAIFFDHDLSLEHYPVFENEPGMKIPYDTYKEKTGLHCARYIVNNNLPLQYWAVHSLNAAGKRNIETELRKYCPHGELKGATIPFRIVPKE